MDELETTENESNMIWLTGEDGEEVEFEFLDLVTYNDDKYMILLPADGDDSEIVILKIDPIDDTTESYVSVGDPDILNAVYEIFKEKFKDIFTFEA